MYPNCNNYNMERNLINKFVKDLLEDRKNSNLDENWQSSSQEESQWNEIAKKLSEVSECEKIIKTEIDCKDIILFISPNSSTVYADLVMQKYFDLLCQVSDYFELIIVNNDELSRWAGNENNVVYWEKNNG